MKKIIITALLFSGIFSLRAQHQSLYSQFMLNGLVVNPAFAGRNDVLEADLLHRRQWTGFDGSPINTAVSIHSPLKSKKTNLGLSVVSDKVGVTSNQYVSGVYAYRFQVKNTFCSFGVQAGINIARTDWESLTRNDVNDNLIVGQGRTQTGITTGAGFYMYNSGLALGVSIPHILNTNGYNSVLQNPVLITGAYSIGMRDSSVIRPSGLVRFVKGSPAQMDLGVSYFYKQKFGGGVSYRTSESMVLSLEYMGVKDFRVAYSYDIGLSKLKGYHNGSHEIILRLFVRWKKKEEENREGETK